MPLPTSLHRLLPLLLIGCAACGGGWSRRIEYAETSFEGAPAGPFTELETELGQWTVRSGRAIVDHQHAKSGSHCLQLLGGKQTVITLRLHPQIDTTGTLAFWAERWTVRSPFVFRVEKQTGSGWVEIYDGDRAVRTGRAFLNHVRVPLGEPNLRQLRFTCVSPAETGVLLDDFRVMSPEETSTRSEHARWSGPTAPGVQPNAARPVLRMPAVFGSHMVLQANAPLPVWGTTAPQQQVTVTLGEETRVTTADSAGEWSVRFAPRAASSTPIGLEARDGETRLSFDDIVIGEVWVCAGQSNMEWRLEQSAHVGQTELANPQLRLLDLTDGPRGQPGSYPVDQLSRLTPAAFVTGRWQVAAAESSRPFSAVAWYFGSYLQTQLDVPIGLICPAVGGSPAEAWIPRQALEQDAELKSLVVGNWLDNEQLGEFCRLRGKQNLQAGMAAGASIPGDDLGPNHPFKPGFLWDAGIQPLIPYAMRGVIWYQGESNAETAARVRQHGRLFPLLVQQWRHHWKQGDFPFLFVQLPAMNRPEWPAFRESQRSMLERLNNVGMAITIDTGHPTDVHPKLKKPVGERLARWALETTYQVDSHVPYSGPLPRRSRRLSSGAPGTIAITFEHVGKGLAAADGKALRHFEMAGPDGVFRTATARIAGPDTVILSCPEINHPTQVRYAWQPYPNPAVNFVNGAGLPATPFHFSLD